MFFNDFDEKSVYNIIVIVFIIIGLLYKFIDNFIPPNYIALVGFCTFKMVFNYKKCTFSYLECKMRKVKREEGLLASFLDHVVDLRTSKYSHLLYILSVFFLINAPFKQMIDYNKLEKIKQKFKNF
jgi:hypothetical protein